MPFASLQDVLAHLDEDSATAFDGALMAMEVEEVVEVVMITIHLHHILHEARQSQSHTGRLQAATVIHSNRTNNHGDLASGRELQPEPRPAMLLEATPTARIETKPGRGRQIGSVELTPLPLIDQHLVTTTAAILVEDQVRRGHRAVVMRVLASAAQDDDSSYPLRSTPFDQGVDSTFDHAVTSTADIFRTPRIPHLVYHEIGLKKSTVYWTRSSGPHMLVPFAKTWA